MSGNQFIDLLEQRRILPERLVAKLRAKVADLGPTASADTLAQFLVKKNYLSQQQVDELLAAPANAEDHGMRLADEAGDAGAGDSSIFPEEIFGRGRREPADADNDAEFRLAPLDEPSSGSSRVLSGASSAGEPDIVDLAALSSDEAFREEVPAHEAELAPALGNLATDDRAKEKVERRLSGAAPKKRTKRKDQWDSPLLLIGGGLLVLLLLCGGAVAFYLFAGSGDERLAMARAARDAGSYLQAVQLYEEFLDKYQRHSARSDARVELAMVRLRQAVEGGGSFEPALRIAQQELPAIEQEISFGTVRDELADLLPDIATGLARQAEQVADNPEEATRLAAATDEALALCRTAKYVPKALRDEAELARIEETLARVRQRQQLRGKLADAIAVMKSAIAAGNPRAAYDTYQQLVREHPELAGNEELAAMIVETSAAERAGVRFVADERAAETTDRPTPWVATLATGNRRTDSTAPESGTYCASIDGALYAFDVPSGQLLWRRYVGFGHAARPTMIGDDVLVTDSKHHELLRLDARSGQLVWRQSIGEPFAVPLAVGERAYVAAESGRLYVLELDSGKRLGYLEFAQPLKVTPAVDRTGERLYLTGDHSSIYAIALRDLSCLGVHYLGHASGSIRVAPAQVLNKLAVVENDGVATCRLLLFSLSEDGSIAKQEAEHRLAGLAATAPMVSARRLIVVTDRGELDAFDVAAGEGPESLTLVATREPTSKQPLVRHVLLSQGAIWVGDTRLTKYAVVPTGNRLPVQTLEHSFAGATFDHPFGLFGETLVSVRRPGGRAGVVVGAIDTATGRIYWENELAVPPVAAPLVDESTRTLAFADVNGLVFRFDEQAVRSRVQDQPLSAGPAGPGAPLLTDGVELAGGRAAFAAPGKSDELVLYDPTADRRPVRRTRVPATIACTPSPFGSGVLVPTEVGQVFYLDPTSGQPLATPFQPPLKPRTMMRYRPACQVDQDGRQFVITDGREKIYLVNRVDEPAPHFVAAAEASVGPYPIASPIVVVGSTALAVTEGGQLVRFQLPSLESVGQTDLPGDVVWGPYRIGDSLLVATADEQLVAVGADGAVAWSAPLEGGDLAGAPLATDDGVLIAYRRGTLEQRDLGDGHVVASLDVEHPLAAGPVQFLGRVVLTAHDGTLLVVDKP